MSIGHLADGLSQLFELNSQYRLQNISVVIGKWTDSFHIHEWFVRHNQADKDDNCEYYVSRELLELLKETCERVLEDISIAVTHIPLSDPDEKYGLAYRYSLEDTVALVDSALALPNDWIFIYGGYRYYL